LLRLKERLLFIALIAVCLVPVWAVEYLPTVDGPCHVYNAQVILQHGNRAEYPRFAGHYWIDWRPIPNWFGQAVLALLMSVFEPHIAEKILVSGYVILLPVAARYAAGSVDPDRRWLGFLIFPLIYHQLFQLGFYNFSYSLAFWLLAVGFWWRRRESPTLRFAVAINLLLLLCWFCHIVSLAVTLLSIGVLWLATLRRSNWRRHLVHIPILAPQIFLPLWFVADQQGGPIPSLWSLGAMAGYLFRLEALFYFGAPQLWIGRVLALAILILAVLTVVGRVRRAEGRLLREEDGFLVLSVLLALLFFLSPEGMSGGGLLNQRLSLYPWLALIPWLAPRLGQAGRAVAVGVLAVLAVWSAAYVLRWYRVLDPPLRAYLAGTAQIRPDSRVLPLLFDRGPYGIYAHLIGYTAAEKGLIDWNNYQAATTYFPTRFHGKRGRTHRYTWIEADPNTIDVRALLPRVDYVYAWGMRPDTPAARRLRRHYRLIYQDGPARLYVPIRRRGAAR
jgi:hypothetical protein